MAEESVLTIYMGNGIELNKLEFPIEVTLRTIAAKEPDAMKQAAVQKEILEFVERRKSTAANSEGDGNGHDRSPLPSVRRQCGVARSFIGHHDGLSDLFGRLLVPNFVAADSGNDADLHLLLDAAQNDNAANVALPADNAALRGLADMVRMSRGMDEFAFPDFCAKCGKADADRLWFTIRSSKRVSMFFENRRTLERSIGVPFCRACNREWNTTSWINGAVAIAVGLAAYFIPMAIWGQSWELQRKIFVFAGAMFASAATYFIATWIFRREFAHIDESGLTLHFSNAEFQRKFDRLNQPIHRAQAYLLHYGAQRWGPPPQVIEQRIRNINDLERLSYLIVHVSGMAGWQDVVRE